MFEAQRTVLVTGATGGIGAPIARAMANEGTQLLLQGRSASKLAAIADELRPICQSVLTLECDLANMESTQAFLAGPMGDFDKIDWIVHAAGYIDEAESEHAPSLENLRRAFNINTLGPIHITQSLQGRLTADGGVIMISSTASLWGNPGFPIYAATKGALNGFTLALAKAFTGTKRTAIAICPGGTNTNMRERIAGDADTQQSPVVIADLVKKITDHASEFGNGDIVVVRDGVAGKHV